MPITLNMPTDLEQRLRDGAAQAGIQLDRFIHGLLEKQMPGESASTSQSAKREAVLLQKINAGFSIEFWENYSALIQKRQAETISQTELAALIEQSDLIEMADARRVKYLDELARLRQISLENLMGQLGIQPRGHA